MIRTPPLEQITAPRKKKKCGLKSYGNKTAIRGTVFNLILHMIVQEPREGSYHRVTIVMMEILITKIEVVTRGITKGYF